MWDDDQTRIVYDLVADTYADHFTGTQGEQPIDLAMIEHFTTLLAGPKVLDAGCGGGRMLRYLAERGATPQGCDLSSRMIHRAKRDHPYPVTVATLTDLPYGDAVFDGYFSWYSTIHSTDDDVRRIIHEARRVLRPNGIALFAFQTGTGIHEVGAAFRARGHDVKLMRFHRRVLDFATALANSGFTITATMEREGTSNENSGQGVVIARVAP